MNIEYKIIESFEKKNELKNEFQDFFFDVFEQKLDDRTWEHQFVHSPYEDSSLFLATHDGAIVGSALMIPQKLVIDGKQIDYYLYTTSAILKIYRAHGIYAKLLEMQREHCKINKKAFIFAFPNKLAYTVLKLFGGFKDMTKTNLVKTKLSQLNFIDIENSLLLDKPLFDWRFEHKAYKFFLHKEHVVIAKVYEGSLDVLAIYNAKSMSSMNIELESIEEDQEIITLELLLQKDTSAHKIDEIKATYYPVNDDLDYTRININLLMSDIF